jgi:Uma2 family endonuclease
MAEPALQPSAMTFEEAALLDPDQYAGEIVQGEWIPVSKNTWRHSEIVSNVSFLLQQYARQQRGWRVGAGDPGSKLSHDPDTLRAPDAAIIREDRRPAGRGAEGWLEGAPDVAVEVVGDGQTASELVKKAMEYLAAGAKMVWVLDPEPQLLLVLTPPNQIRILGAEDTLDAGAVLPGFTCKVSEFFE